MMGKERGTPQIKICGITEPAEAAYLNEIHAAYAGFVLWKKSRRNISFVQAEAVRRLLDRKIKQVAVTVSPDFTLMRQIESAGFDILQVHGALREEVVAQCNIPIWRACNVEKTEDIINLEQHERITGYVIDAGKAGSGRTFDWEKSYKAVEEMRNTAGRGKIFVLAGGLNPQNIAEAVRLFHPDVVDVSSGVEGSRGKKNRMLVQEFARSTWKNDRDV